MSNSLDKQIQGWKPLADKAFKEAKKLGVQAMVTISTNSSLKVKVRMGELEELKQTKPEVLSLRLYKGKRSASGTTAHINAQSVERLVKRVAQSVDLVDEDDANGLPDEDLLYVGKGKDLELFDPKLVGFSVDKAREMALACEKAALDVDKHVKNSSGGVAGVSMGAKRIFNSRGLDASHKSTGVYVQALPVAESDDGEKNSDWWYHYTHHLDALEDPKVVGKKAGQRSLRLLGAQSDVKTGTYPVLFVPETANTLLGHLFECASGDQVYKNTTYLAKRLETRVAADAYRVVDDPHRVRGMDSKLFDDEGVATRKRTLVDGGKLMFYPCDTFSARRLGQKSTGHAGGSGVTSHNLYVENGDTSLEELLKKMDTGLMVTAFIGFGLNRATGDFSRGIRGFWVEGGKPVRPVQEITVSSNLDDMYKGIIGIGNDLEFRFDTNSPSILIDKMTVSGK